MRGEKPTAVESISVFAWAQSPTAVRKGTGKNRVEDGGG
jgi:hypothetical protein